jgi:hypothetical protein
MTTERDLPRAAGTWLASSLGATAVLIALGWLPWGRLGGERGTSALLVGAAVTFLGALLGALPVLRAVGSPGARPAPVVAGWSTALRMTGTLLFALVAALGTDLPRSGFLIAVGAGYLVLLLVETKWTLRWLRASEAKSAK